MGLLDLSADFSPKYMWYIISSIIHEHLTLELEMMLVLRRQTNTPGEFWERACLCPPSATSCGELSEVSKMNKRRNRAIDVEWIIATSWTSLFIVGLTRFQLGEMVFFSYMWWTPNLVDLGWSNKTLFVGMNDCEMVVSEDLKCQDERTWRIDCSESSAFLHFQCSLEISIADFQGFFTIISQHSNLFLLECF